MTETDCQRRVQDQFGIEYKKTEDSFVMFETQLLNPSAVVSSNPLLGNQRLLLKLIEIKMFSYKLRSPHRT